MNYQGVIIEESLEDKHVIGLVHILNTKIENVTEKHRTPWIKKWTLHTIEIPEKQGENISKIISSSLDKKHNWYADFKNDKFHYIIFFNKVFKVDLNNPILYKDAKTYGIFLGIPEYQVDFTPGDQVWDR